MPAAGGPTHAWAVPAHVLLLQPRKVTLARPGRSGGGAGGWGGLGGSGEEGGDGGDGGGGWYEMENT